MVAGLSVGAVKHSGVFSCDWDSLGEESVRHGAWLSVCWSSSGGLREYGAVEEAARAHLCLPPHPACSILSFLSSLTHLPSCSLLHPLPLPPFHLSTGVHFLWFAEAHYQFPTNFHPQPASQQQHTTTRSKPQEGQQLDWCLSKNPLLLTCVANPSHHVCCRYCKCLIVLYRRVVSQVLFLLRPKQSSIIKDGARCARQPWQV